MKRDRPITIIAALNFAAAGFLLVFLVTDFTNVVPLQLDVLLGTVGVVHCALGWGLLKLKNWARVGTAIVSTFWGIPSVVEILSAFRSLDFAKLFVHLLFVTVYSMVVAYLVHPSVRQVFEEPPIELRLK
jgi:hypothetical protein